MTDALPELTANHHALLVRRIDNLVASAPVASLAAIFAALAMAIVLIDPKIPLLATGWLALVVMTNLARLFLPQIVDADQTEADRANQLWDGHVACCWLTGLAYAAGLPLLLNGANGVQAAFAFLAVGGLLGATLVACKAAPGALRGFVVLVTIGGIASAWLVAGRFAMPMAIVLLAQAAILVRVIVAQEALFLGRVERDAVRSMSDATARLLLDGYEEHSTDWLWTADTSGRLRAVSDRFCAVTGLEEEALEGMALPELFSPGPERDRLVAALAQHEPFRELVLPLVVHGKPRAWALSARMLDDGRMTGFARDVTAARRAEEKAAQLAHFDPLTGLANRKLLARSLRQLASEEPERGLALFILDVDDFKALNDTQGHLLGDKLLKAIGERLAANVRKGDLLARLGGDEFAILMRADGTDRALAERAARIGGVIGDPFIVAGQELRVTASIGIARGEAAQCEAQELMRRADLALHAAKERGRGSFALFDPALDEAARTRRAIETGLQGAIARGELEVHFQSVIELDSGRVTGHEALLRWNHPHLGAVSPAQFIPVAEASGLIVPLGEWVIEEALREVASWTSEAQISINISPVQMRSANLVPTIARALEVNGIAAGRLELEITEGALLRNSEANRAVLLKLRELGVRIALDDFGTGYSSLGYLRAFPFDRIKIDRSFVADVVEQADSQAIIAAVTRLAAALGMRTTAEGVERLDQLDMLRKLGCNEAQGFLIARPVKASELDDEVDAQLALPAPLPAEIIDYRKARKAAQRRAKQERTARTRRA